MIDHWEAEFQMGYIIYIQAMQGSDFTLTLLISIIYIGRKSEMSQNFKDEKPYFSKFIKVLPSDSDFASWAIIKQY